MRFAVFVVLLMTQVSWDVMRHWASGFQHSSRPSGCLKVKAPSSLFS